MLTNADRLGVLTDVLGTDRLLQDSAFKVGVPSLSRLEPQRTTPQRSYDRGDGKAVQLGQFEGRHRKGPAVDNFRTDAVQPFGSCDDLGALVLGAAEDPRDTKGETIVQLDFLNRKQERLKGYRIQ